MSYKNIDLKKRQYLQDIENGVLMDSRFHISRMNSRKLNRLMIRLNIDQAMLRDLIFDMLNEDKFAKRFEDDSDLRDLPMISNRQLEENLDHQIQNPNVQFVFDKKNTKPDNQLSSKDLKRIIKGILDK